MDVGEQVVKWDGSRTIGIRSRGASNKLYLVHPQDNLLLNEGSPWPNPRIKKISQPAKRSWFSPEGANLLAADLGYISYLQSTDSEDAITWSFFGTLLERASASQVDVLNWLCAELGEPAGNTECHILLWSRHAHPHTGKARNGPEIDFVLVGNDTVLLGEAKWRAAEGASQGIEKNRSQTQMRQEYVQAFGAQDYGDRKIVLVALERTSGVLAPRESGDSAWRRMSWSRLAECEAHPLRDSYAEYLRWKEQITQPRKQSTKGL